VRVIPRNVDSPVELFLRARDRKVFETATNERDDLVAGRFRLDELWVLLIEVEQRLGEFAELEEVVCFLKALDRSGVNGTNGLAEVVTLAVDEVGFGFVFLAANAVVALVRTAIDEPGVVEVLKKLLNVALVTLFGGANEVLVVDINRAPADRPRP
jgi:hypothetical protein